MRDPRGTPVPMTGGSSLLVIFSVLCLTIFALLSVSTARANRSLSEQSAQASISYYEADLRAEQILSQLRAGTCPEGVANLGEGNYAYVCPLNEELELQVKVQVEGELFRVFQWQLCSKADWQTQDDLTVWNGAG